METMLQSPPLFAELEQMREKWKRGAISTRQYHNFIEDKKRSLRGNDSVYQL